MLRCVAVKDESVGLFPHSIQAVIICEEPGTAEPKRLADVSFTGPATPVITFGGVDAYTNPVAVIKKINTATNLLNSFIYLVVLFLIFILIVFSFFTISHCFYI